MGSVIAFVQLGCFLSILFDVNLAGSVHNSDGNNTSIVIVFDDIDELKDLINTTLETWKSQQGNVEITNHEDVYNFSQGNGSFHRLCHDVDEDNSTNILYVNKSNITTTSWNLSSNSRVTLYLWSSRFCGFLPVEAAAPAYLQIAICVIIALSILVVAAAVGHCVWRKKKRSRLPSVRSPGGSERERLGPPYYKRVQLPKPVSPPSNRLSRPLSVPPSETLIDASYETPHRPRAATEDFRTVERRENGEPFLSAVEYDVPTNLPVYETVVG